MRLEGKPVAEKIKEEVKAAGMLMRQEGRTPTVAVVRIGEQGEDIAYENRVIKNCSEIGFHVRQVTLPQWVSQELLQEQLTELNEDCDVLGILLLRPLPSHLDEMETGKHINVEKDIDCMNSANLSQLLMGGEKRISPCTPEAVIEMLRYYNIPIKGKHVVIVNRSLVLGKPLALLFLEEDATVTVCHSKTEDLAGVMRTGDIVVTGVGRAGYFDASYFHPNAIVMDVGINFSDGKMCGDVNYDAVCEYVRGVSPVPGGVGAVTSAVLLRHCIG